MHTDGRCIAKRCQEEHFMDAAVQKKVAYGGGSAMVWGAFNLHYRTPLDRVEGNMTGPCDRDEIVTPFTLPSLQQMGPHNVY